MYSVNADFEILLPPEKKQEAVAVAEAVAEAVAVAVAVAVEDDDNTVNKQFTAFITNS